MYSCAQIFASIQFHQNCCHTRPVMTCTLYCSCNKTNRNTTRLVLCRSCSTYLHTWHFPFSAKAGSSLASVAYLQPTTLLPSKRTTLKYSRSNSCASVEKDSPVTILSAQTSSQLSQRTLSSLVSICTVIGFPSASQPFRDVSTICFRRLAASVSCNSPME